MCLACRWLASTSWLETATPVRFRSAAQRPMHGRTCMGCSVGSLVVLPLCSPIGNSVINKQSVWIFYMDEDAIMQFGPAQDFSKFDSKFACARSARKFPRNMPVCMVQFAPLLTRYLRPHMQQTWRCCSLESPASAQLWACAQPPGSTQTDYGRRMRMQQ